MSIYKRTYICRFAPCSTTDREAIRNGVDVVFDGRRMTESFAPDAFLATTERVPVILSHDPGKPAGYLTQRIVHNGWHIGPFTLDHSHWASAVALDRLKRGTPVSIGAHTLRHDESLAELGVLRHTFARLDELSILAADEHPAITGAKIIDVLERSEAPYARTPARPVASATPEWLPRAQEEAAARGTMIRYFPDAQITLV